MREAPSVASSGRHKTCVLALTPWRSGVGAKPEEVGKAASEQELDPWRRPSRGLGRILGRHYKRAGPRRFCAYCRDQLNHRSAR